MSQMTDVMDRSQLKAVLPLDSFHWVPTAAISRIVPSLIPVLGNEVVTVRGAALLAGLSQIGTFTGKICALVRSAGCSSARKHNRT